jgi:hypothetical protein
MTNKIIWAAWALQPGENICMEGYDGSAELKKRIRKDQNGFSLLMKLFLSESFPTMSLIC